MALASKPSPQLGFWVPEVEQQMLMLTGQDDTVTTDHDAYGFRLRPVLLDAEAYAQFIRTTTRAEPHFAPRALGFSKCHLGNRVSFQFIPGDGFRYDFDREHVIVLADQCESLGKIRIATRLREFANHAETVAYILKKASSGQ
jgi:hypothetical protein